MKFGVWTFLKSICYDRGVADQGGFTHGLLQGSAACAEAAELEINSIAQKVYYNADKFRDGR